MATHSHSVTVFKTSPIELSWNDCVMEISIIIPLTCVKTNHKYKCLRCYSARHYYSHIRLIESSVGLIGIYNSSKIKRTWQR